MCLQLRELTYLAVGLRILAALIMGGVLGLERGMKNRPAGLRTYMLVCVGSCLIMLTNQYLFQVSGAGDPMRLGAQVVSGIGFLGAGTIIVTKHNQIKGLTTAAGLWASAGVGLAFGVGFYEGALTAAIGIYSILTILQRWEKRLHKRVRTLDVYIELLAAVPLSEFIQNIRTLDFHIEDVQFEQDSTLEANTRAIVLTLKAQKREDHLILLDRIRRLEGVVHLEEL